MKRPISLAIFLLSTSVFGAELPRILIDTRYDPPVGGSTIVVGDGGNFATALTTATCGDIITLNAGSTYTGQFTLPYKACSGWIYIRTSTLDSAFPRPGRRVGPSDASLMAKITGSTTPSVINTEASAHHYRFVGIEITPGVFMDRMVALDGGVGDVDTQVNNIVFDRCYIHGNATLGGRHGISAQGAYISVIDSYLSDFMESGPDTQAFVAWQGTGPYKLVNNYFSAAGENVMFGGAWPGVDVGPELIPSDIEIRRNHFFKPLNWWPLHGTYDSSTWTVKNSFELKFANRVLVENNLFENHWCCVQAYIISIKSSVNDGFTDARTVDVNFRGNYILNGPGGLNLVGFDAGPTNPTTDVAITNNLWKNIGTDFDSASAGNAFAVTNGMINPSLEHNTMLNSGGSALGTSIEDSTGFVYRYNIQPRGIAGVKGDGTGEGTATLEAWFPGYVFTANVLQGATCGSYPATTLCPATMGDIEFEDFDNGDYRLDAASDYYGVGDGASDLGAWIPSATAALNQLDWNLTLQGNGTNTGGVFTFGVPGLPFDQSCDVRVGSSVTTSATGPATRSVVVTGLSNGQSYFIGVDCGTTWGGAVSYVNFAAATPSGGDRTIPIQLPAPPAILSGAARATVDYGTPSGAVCTTADVGVGSVQNTSCGSGCTPELTLAAGAYCYRWRWQNASDTVLATSAVQPILVQ